MSFLLADKIAAAQIAFSTQFNEFFAGLKLADPAYGMLATEIPSTTKITQHNWMGVVPAFTEFVGERKIARLNNNNYQIANKKWANGIEVDEDDLEDDALGMYMPKIQQLAMMAALHKVDLLMDFLVNGFATTSYGAGYDGVAFFAATHKHAGEGASLDNKLTATLDDAGAFNSAVVKMMSFVDANGTPLYMTPTHLIVGPSNRENALNILKAQLGSGGASNINFGFCELVVSPKLIGSHAAKWFLCDLSKPIKPLIFQNRRGVQFKSVGEPSSGETSEQRFMTGKIKFGCDARYNVGYGAWECIVGSEGTA